MHQVQDKLSKLTGDCEYWRTLCIKEPERSEVRIRKIEAIKMNNREHLEKLRDEVADLNFKSDD